MTTSKLGRKKGDLIHVNDTHRVNGGYTANYHSQIEGRDDMHRVSRGGMLRNVSGRYITNHVSMNAL